MIRDVYHHINVIKAVFCMISFIGKQSEHIYIYMYIFRGDAIPQFLI